MDSIQFSHKGDRFVCNDGLFTVRNEKNSISKSTKSYLCSLKIPTKGLYKKNSDRNAAKISKHRPNEKLFIQTGASSLSNLHAIKISIKKLYTM